MKIILGSQSPRRKELLAGLDVQFRSLNIDANEHYPAHLQGGDIAKYVSIVKADAYPFALEDDEVLLTADTIVWVPSKEGGTMLGKPKSEQEAKAMLRLLSGRMHEVYTGVTMRTATTSQTIVDKTEVWFHDLSDQEIEQYILRYRPMDKAGAYGVQEWIGYVAVAKMVGSYFNVMGFPIDKVYAMLQSLGEPLPYVSQVDR